MSGGSTCIRDGRARRPAQNVPMGLPHALVVPEARHPRGDAGGGSGSRGAYVCCVQTLPHDFLKQLRAAALGVWGRTWCDRWRSVCAAARL